MSATPMQLRWMLATCGYICFFTGVPTLIFRLVKPAAASFHLRVAVLVLVPVSMSLPDIVHYVFWRPEVLNLGYGRRHLLNPVRTMSNWQIVEGLNWFVIPLVIGLIGVVAYLVLIQMGARMTAEAAAIDPGPSTSSGQAPASSGQAHSSSGQAAATGKPTSADIVY